VFSEFARVNIPDAWHWGHRNPVKYADLGELGIDLSQLHWEPMPEPSEMMLSLPAEADTLATTDIPLTMAQAKKGLALTFGVAPEAIEITIHG
jgi:hypothetical protein